MKKVNRKRNYRLSKAVLLKDSGPVFEFPSAAMVKKMLSKNGALHTLAGFENNYEDGKDCNFNFVLSNGTRSTQFDKDYPTKYSFMIPKDALNKIRSVTIQHYFSRICGFHFFDKDGALLWKIGDTDPDFFKETVLLAENEVIVGVVAKLYHGCQSFYTDFQFQIAFEWRVEFLILDTHSEDKH